jgi:hypothetical protein
MPLLFRVSKSDEGTNYEFGGLTILFTGLAAIGTFGNFYLNLAAKAHLWPCIAGCS